MRYQAFVSYRHDQMGIAHAEALESALKRYARPVWRRPPRIFRDETHVKAGEDLSVVIPEALEDSEFLIYLASAEAAKSEWVRKEIEQWLRQPERHKRVVVVWIADTIRFCGLTLDWSESDAVPQELSAIGQSPLVSDLRWAKTSEQRDLRHERYLKEINSIAARLRGMAPEELSGEEVRVFRRNRWFWMGLGLGITVMAIVALVLAFIAKQQRDAALKQNAANSWSVQGLQLARTDRTRGLNAVYLAHEHGSNQGIDGALRTLLLEGAFYEVNIAGEAIADTKFSPDGETFAVAFYDRVVVYSLGGQELSSIYPGAGTIAHFAFSPSGKRVAISSFEGRTGIWSREGKHECSVDTEGVSSLRGLAWNPKREDELLLWTSEEGAWLQDVASGKRSFLTSSSVVGAAFALDGESVFFLFEGVETCDRYDRKGRVLQTFPGKSRCLAVAKEHVALGDGAGQVSLLDLRSGESTLFTQDRHGPVSSVSLSPDGRLLSAGFRGYAGLWEIEGRRQLISNEDHDSSVDDVDISPDGKHWVTRGYQEMRARLWSTTPVVSPTESVRTRGEWVLGADVTSDGAIAIAGTGLWIRDARGKERQIGQTDAQYVQVTFEAGGDRLIALDEAGKAQVFDRSGRILGETEGAGASFLAEDLQNGRFVTAPRGSGKATVWTTLGESQLTFPRDPINISCMDVHGGAGLIALGTFSGELRIFDFAGQQKRVLEGSAGPVMAVAFSEDASQILAGDGSRQTTLWGFERGETLRVLGGVYGYPDRITAVAFQPDTGRIVTAGSNGLVFVWSEEGYPILRVGYPEHSVIRLAFREGRILLGVANGFVHTWPGQLDPKALMESGRVARFSKSDLGLWDPQ